MPSRADILEQMRVTDDLVTALTRDMARQQDLSKRHARPASTASDGDAGASVGDAPAKKRRRRRRKPAGEGGAASSSGGDAE